MSLYEAFMLRNDLKDQLNTAISNSMECLYFTEGDQDISKENLNKKYLAYNSTINGTINSIEVINLIIEDANKENKELIYKINSFNTLIKYYEDVYSNLKNLKKYDKDFINGTLVKLENIIAVDKESIQKLIQNLKMNKREVEKILNSNNARIKVQVPIEDDKSEESTTDTESKVEK